MNVCLIKAAAFAPQGNFKGGSQLFKELKIFKAEIHTKCWEWVTDNGFERLPDENSCIWLPGVFFFRSIYALKMLYANL